MFLVFLNINSVLRHKNSVPKDFNETITKKDYNLSVEYTLEKEKFSLLQIAVNFLLLFIVILTGLPSYVDQIIQGFNLPWFFPEFLFLLILSIPFSILSSLFDFYSTFVIEEKFGFNKMTLRLLISDALKSNLVALILGVPLLWGFFELLEKGGNWWWLLAFGGYTLFQLMITALYPIIIAPLFNKFTPLEDGELKESLNTLAKQCQFKTKGIFVMDESRRSGHSNAYFTGMGPSKRIVLFNTLIDQLSVAELTAVLAHEIGHYKHKHILKRTITSTGLSFIFFFLLSQLIQWSSFFKAFGFEQPEGHSIIFLLTITLPLLTFFLNPIINGFSRKDEYQADRYAAQKMEDGEPLIKALLGLNKENHSNLSPDRLYSRFYYSHPVLQERITEIRRVKFPDKK